jgi:uncharacterized repeat protein (TIGR03943 family)
MTARTQAFVLLLFGAALVRLAAGDALLHFVRPVARPYVLAAGVAILALAVWTIGSAARATHDPALDDPAPDPHGHRGASHAAWLVLAPVVAVLVVPPALGSYSAARAPATIAKPADVSFPPLPPGNPAPVKVVDFATRARWDDGRTLTGRTVSVTGFALRPGVGRFILARLVITCCAADARAVEVGVVCDAPPPAQDAWVVVTGTYAGISQSDAMLPLLHATAIRPIAQPTNPYE